VTNVSSGQDLGHCRAESLDRCTTQVTQNRPLVFQRCLLATNVFSTDDGHCRAHRLAI
jgi:hypothetical protein